MDKEIKNDLYHEGDGETGDGFRAEIDIPEEPVEFENEEVEEVVGRSHNDEWDEGEKKDNKEPSWVTQWAVHGPHYLPTSKTIEKIPPGFYEPSMFNRQLCLKKNKIYMDKILRLPDDTLQLILNDIENFWTRKSIYREYDFVCKRGILLYGPPGCGKSTAIQLLAETLIKEYQGIVVNIPHPDSLDLFSDVMASLKQIEPDKKFITIVEDIDNFVSNRSVTTQLLNVLDGHMKLDDMVTIATTNYPEKLQERITNRPSRFDRRYEIDVPNADVREYYIRHMVKEKDLKSIDMKLWINDTDKFTLDHLKELVLSVFVLGMEYEQALADINNMVKNGALRPTTISTRKSVGFDKK